MGFLAGKRIVVTGVLSNRSIAYGITQAMQREGAELILTYQGERFRERVGKFAEEFGAVATVQCDVQDDATIAALTDTLAKQWGYVDGLVFFTKYSTQSSRLSSAARSGE